MVNGDRRYTIRLDPALFRQVEVVAARLQVPTSTVFRRAIELYLAGEKRLSETEYRHHKISEFTQIAVDSIIRRDFPELVDPILLETEKRMEKHHGRR